MPRKLKVYQTSQGFYDLAVAAPSMKAALEAWGSARTNLFHHGLAKESKDGKIIAAAMAKPGVVLQRPVGSQEAFREHAHLPTASLLASPRPQENKRSATGKTPQTRKADAKAERRVTAAYEKEQRRQERQRLKEEAATAKKRARREAAKKRAETRLQLAERKHEDAAAAIERDLKAVQRRAEMEQKRWDRSSERLREALRKAGE